MTRIFKIEQLLYITGQVPSTADNEFDKNSIEFYVVVKLHSGGSTSGFGISFAVTIEGANSVILSHTANVAGIALATDHLTEIPLPLVCFG